MRLAALALLLPLAACERPPAPPSSEGTENPDVTTPVEVPPEAAASAPDSAAPDTARAPRQPEP